MSRIVVEDKIKNIFKKSGFVRLHENQNKKVYSGVFIVIILEGGFEIVAGRKSNIKLYNKLHHIFKTTPYNYSLVVKANSYKIGIEKYSTIPTPSGGTITEQQTRVILQDITSIRIKK